VERNPWLDIPASDYEGHMGPQGADQLRVLSGLFAEAYARARPARVAVLGCATGNGFEYVDPAVTGRLLGLDLHPGYLAVAASRHARLGAVLELQCTDVSQVEIDPGSLDLVFAGLFFEYVDPDPVLRRLAGWLKPGGVLAVVLQLPAAACAEITPTRFTSIRKLSGFLRLVPPDRFDVAAREAGLEPGPSRTVPIKGGKEFRFAEYLRPEASPGR
jgi:SAM-dependent methyltransferase